MSNINEMAEFIVSRYGDTIRGRKVSSMSNEQICAIYKSIMERDAKAKQPQNTTAGRCQTCGWFSNGICAKTGTAVNATSLACRRYYDDKTKLNHQYTLFEGNRAQ